MGVVIGLLVVDPWQWYDLIHWQWGSHVTDYSCFHSRLRKVLNLLGAMHPLMCSYFLKMAWLFNTLVNAETCLRAAGILDSTVNVLYCTDLSYTEAEILQVEKYILKTLEWL